MELTPVTSTNVKAHGYDPATQALTVVYHDGGAHTYEGVPAHKYAALLSAPSVGRYVASHIKPVHQGRKG